jgi:uncharacterized protein
VNTVRATFLSGDKPSVNLTGGFISQMTGMRGKLSLPKDSGQLFEFPIADDYGFWMEGVSIPLDIIFLNEEDEVVFIFEEAQPYSVDPIKAHQPILRVIEVNGGWCKINNVSLGTKVVFDFL